MHSLGVYDKGKLLGEGARYQDDIKSGNIALELFHDPINEYNRKQSFFKKKMYKPRKEFMIGNHEYRLTRHVNANPELQDKLSYRDFSALWDQEWNVHEFLEVVEIGGIYFSHYFVNPDSAKKLPFSSSVDFQLRSLGHSFVYGHQQGLKIAAPRYTTDGRAIRGLVCGSFYQHEEEYMGPQGNDYWRGAIMLRHVERGMYQLEELPLKYLMKEYL